VAKSTRRKVYYRWLVSIIRRWIILKQILLFR
jgi:hypothetical protein